jgi:hypothetical protein
VIWLSAVFDSRLFPRVSVKAASIANRGPPCIHFDGQALELLRAAAQRLANCRLKRFERAAHLRHGVLNATLGAVELAASIAIAMSARAITVRDRLRPRLPPRALLPQSAAPRASPVRRHRLLQPHVNRIIAPTAYVSASMPVLYSLGCSFGLSIRTRPNVQTEGCIPARNYSNPSTSPSPKLISTIKFQQVTPPSTTHRRTSHPVIDSRG